MEYLQDLEEYEKTILVNGELYYTKRQFERIVDRSAQTITRLMTRGNKHRRLNYLKIGVSIFIPASELKDYPFTTAGRNSKTYYYTEKGYIDTVRSDKTLTEEI